MFAILSLKAPLAFVDGIIDRDCYTGTLMLTLSIQFNIVLDETDVLLDDLQEWKASQFV